MPIPVHIENDQSSARPQSDTTVTGEPTQTGSNTGANVMKLPLLALAAATVLAGLSAGFFFAYEASVTLGLAEVDDVTYVETFQAINNTIRNPACGLVFLGSLPAIALAAAANWRTSSPVVRGVLATAMLMYLAGVMITFSGNVPLNNELGELTTVSPQTAAVARAGFENDWNRLDLIRSITFAASFALLTAASILVPARAHGSDITTGQTG